MALNAFTKCVEGNFDVSNFGLNMEALSLLQDYMD